MTNLALCGLGRIGAVHLNNIQSLRGCRAYGVFDIDGDRAARCASQTGARAYSTLEAMLQDPAVHGVVIATPSSSHRPIALDALAAGKHVFIEKPLAGTDEDAAAIAVAANASGLCVQVGFCERFNPHYIEAKRAVHEGRLGAVRTVQSSRLAPFAISDPAWELGALDTAVHNFDLILWILERVPVSVRAYGVPVYTGSEVLHSVNTILRFDDGSVAMDHVAWIREDAHPLRTCARSRMLLMGDKGCFEVDLNTRPAALLTAEEYSMRDTVILGGSEYYGCLKLQFEAFLTAIEQGTPSRAPVADALLAERVALAAAESLRTGAEVEL